MAKRVGKRFMLIAIMLQVARQMKQEGWGDKPHGEALAEFTRRVVAAAQKAGLDLDEIIDLIEQLLPLIEAILEIILGLFADKA